MQVKSESVSRIIKAALGYSQLLKWAVFPLHSIVNGHCTCRKDCASPGKHPRTHNGLKSATSDTNVIKEWFSKWPDSNIGIATGKVSGFFVLDIDPKNQGHISMELLTARFGELPDTVHAITGSKGSHYLFKYQEGIRNKTDIWPGIDIRGDGGYIVTAPSKHMSGRQYEWELSSKPYINPIAEAPKWLLDKIIKPKMPAPIVKPSSHWVEIMQGVGEGNRNNAAASLAGYLFKRYVDPSLVVEIVHLWNERNDPPLKINELNQILNSIAGKELARRQGGEN